MTASCLAPTITTLGPRHPTLELALHHRLASAVLRAALVGIALAPIVAVIAARDSGSWKEGPLVAWVGAVALAGAAFQLERRDGRAIAVVLRAVAAAALVAVAAPLAIAWVQHPGSPGAAVDELARTLRLERYGLLGLAVGLVGTAPVWALLLLVRSRTARVGPQVLAGALTFGLPAALVLLAERAGPPGLAPLLGAVGTGALAALLVALVDRAPELAAPIRIERPVRPLILAWLVVAPFVATGAVGAAGQLQSLKATNERSAIGSLKLIFTAQELHRQGDVLADGRQLYAASLAALTLVPGCPALEAERLGYRFRVARDAQYPDALWCADATPIDPGVTGDRCFFVNQAGSIGYRMTSTGSSPAELDPSQPMPPGYIILCK